MVTISQLLSHAAFGGAENHLDRETILSSILKCDRIDLYKEPGKIITPQQGRLYHQSLAKYERGYPIAYLIGYKEFMSLDFIVTQDVLIPRPETELLVEEAIRSIEHKAKSIEKMRIAIRSKPPATDGTISILDIGTGSGNIAVSLAKYLIKLTTHNAQRTTPFMIFASDISRKALNIARLNARRHKVSKYIRFYYGDLFEPFKGLKADIIISNPPYVDRKDKSKWERTIKYEPSTALWAGKKGLFYIEKIIKQSPDYLKHGGYLLLELGQGQSKVVLNLILRTVSPQDEPVKSTKPQPRRSGINSVPPVPIPKAFGRNYFGANSFKDIKILSDYNKIPRILCARRSENIFSNFY